MNARDWSEYGRPTRNDWLRPRGIREQLGAWIAKPLLKRWDRELGAETMRSNDGWEEVVRMRRTGSTALASPEARPE